MKGEVAYIYVRLGLTNGSLLSPILFLVFINYLPSFCPKETDIELKENKIGMQR